MIHCTIFQLVHYLDLVYLIIRHICEASEKTFLKPLFDSSLTNLILSRYFWGIFFPCQIKCIIFGTSTACFLSDIVAYKYSSALLNIMYHEDMTLDQWKLNLERFWKIYPLHKSFLEVIKEDRYIVRGDCIPLLQRHICDWHILYVAGNLQIGRSENVT